MTRRERLLRTFRGETTDRPPVCFYEINGLTQCRDDLDPYNIYSHPSWTPLLDLAAEKTDRIVLTGVGFQDPPPDPLAAASRTRTWTDDEGARWTKVTVDLAGETRVTRHRRDRDIDTVWTVEHLLRDAADLRRWLALPARAPARIPDTARFVELEQQVGSSGIVAVDIADPLCHIAPLFSMEDYTVVALTEPALFREALERVAAWLLPQAEAIAAALPGRHWRIVGPEYACPPYLPPALFREYVVPYVRAMAAAVRRHGGYPRMHCHGRLEAVLPDIVATGVMGLDPVEPPPQGDVSLAQARDRADNRLVLFGNLEASDIENLPPAAMRQKVRTALAEGPGPDGGGFVLMPSACPYGRVLSPRALRNYEVILEETGVVEPVSSR